MTVNLRHKIRLRNGNRHDPIETLGIAKRSHPNELWVIATVSGSKGLRRQDGPNGRKPSFNRSGDRSGDLVLALGGGKAFFCGAFFSERSFGCGGCNQISIAIDDKDLTRFTDF